MSDKTFEQGKDEIADLCKRFDPAVYHDPKVKEADVRQNLIDPLFEALGWDVQNRERRALRYRQVLPAESLEIEGHQKLPDYTFRIGPSANFYVEAKKCTVDIGTDPAPAFQLRRYGWNKDLGVSILTNFEQFAVYDCTQRPRPSHKAGSARILYLRHTEYVDRWRELWDMFSPGAVLSGAFDKYAGSKKRPTEKVDAEFLKEIEGWRDVLARNVALRNRGISSDDLNAAVQATIDRVVFLRMAEDRGLEPSEQLLKLCARDDVYQRFMRTLCRRADEKYNSGLFHFQREEGVPEEPDRITPKLAVDDKVFKPILQGLYVEHGSPYDFRIMPLEILGTIYERFLGKVIRLTKSGQAKVEEKPEVRAAKGVHYTPAYIAEYIVERTVGRQIDGRSPAELAGGKGKPPFSVLDPACGSGTFLLGAYQHLLDHCLKWYTEHHPEACKKAVYKDSAAGEWRLTIEEKKRILTAHIFGVDIDHQAVEVTKLSLLLKVLEGETDQSMDLQYKLFHERALPNLGENIKCGNSLIGTDYFEGKLISDPDEKARVNAFDWKLGFPRTMRAGGFDCVVGNPPYVRIQVMKAWAPLEVEAYKDIFQAGKTGNYDIYVVFIEQGLKLLGPKGQLGFICPHKFFNSQYGEPLRKLIAEGKHLSQVVHFGAQQVFDGATTYTCLLFLDESPALECQFAKVDDLTAWRVAGTATTGLVKADAITAGEWNFAVGQGATLFAKLSAMPHKLGDVADVFVGLQTSADDVYIMDFVAETARTIRLRSKALVCECTLEKALFYPLVSGTDVRRYGPLPSRQYILFPYTVQDERPCLIDFKNIQRNHPKTAAYLLENKDRLEDRENGDFRDANWHRFGRSQNLGIQNRVKLCVPRLVEQLHAAYDHDGNHFLDNVDVGGVTLKAAYAPQGLEYLLALLNCRLLRWYFPQVSAPFRGGWRSANRQFLSLLPIRVLDFKNTRDRAAHGQLAAFATSMLTLYKQLAAANSEAQKAVIQRQIDATDAEIDRLVYDLYGLTAEEIAIVEDSTANGG
jgi:hypothetical protein